MTRIRSAGPRHRTGEAFTLIELVVVLAIAGLLLVVALPASRAARQESGLAKSMANVRAIMVAAHLYHFDHVGQVPMRACGYSGGQVTGGWDGWNSFGKNCDSLPGSPFWQGQVFDESAYSRFLNAYLYPARIPRPPGYVSTGIGSTWFFNHGIPTAQQRASLEMEVCHSPGDTSTRQRNWPNPTPGISGYDDVGTSYILNMFWWDQFLALPFGARYEEGLRRIRLAFDGANPSYVWIADQTADWVATVSGSNILGEFGKINASVCGFADASVRYMQLIPRAHSGPGYTFWL